MRIASITMVGQFPDGIGLHVRNLRWALSDEDHIFIVTNGSFIRKYALENDDRTTYINFGECDDIQRVIHFWTEFPRIVRTHRIDPKCFLFMQQDNWFHQKIARDPLPEPQLIRSHLPLLTDYHAVTVDDRLLHPRMWEGSTLLHGLLVRRAIEFGIDFSAHRRWFINRDKAHWDRVAGGRIALAEYEAGDMMDEFGLYCALVEKTTMTYCPRAAHLQGPESLHRHRPDLYDGCDDERLRAVAEAWSGYCSVYAAGAVYYIAGNWKEEADWRRMQRRFRPEFAKLIPSAKDWMKPDEYERLEKVVAAF
jgi:hypothetical protein